jgi:hypothetical protein
MGDIIHLRERSETVPDNLVTSRPWEFRRADWASRHFIQMLKSQSAKLESHRVQVYKQGNKRIWHLPTHFTLQGGMAYTIQAIYTCRNDESKMREVYYLAGLMDCMINRFNPLLRTDLVRDLYKRIMALKKRLKVNWYGQMDQVLFPIDTVLYNTLEYTESLSKAQTMKELYRIIRGGTDEMFDILGLSYVFYSPGKGA